MKRQTLVNGLLSLTAVTLMTGCTDDKYDLKDIDTTSRFTVDNLTVPVNLSQIKLESVIDLDDNDLIEKVEIDGRECYSIVQKGDINPTEFSVGTVHVPAPSIDDTNIHVGLSGLPFAPGTYISLPFEDTVDLFSTSSPTLVDYKFEMTDVNKALKQLNDVKTVNPIWIRVDLTVPSSLIGAKNKFSFKNLRLRLPWGLDLVQSNEYTIVSTKDENGNPDLVVEVPELSVSSTGKATLHIGANGLTLGSKGIVQFPNGENQPGQLGIEGKVGVLAGRLYLNLQGITLPASIDIKSQYRVSEFDLKSFSGRVNYDMESIHIDPITLDDLPEFLDNPNTNIVIANPQILVSIKNPVGKWLNGHGKITLISNFNKDGHTVKVPYSSEPFSIVGNSADLAFCTPKDGFDFYKFDGLRDVLSDDASGLPTSIEVNIDNINFEGTVNEFPLGDLGSAEGSYEFNAPLGFGDGTEVIYETTEDGWGGDDMDDLNIKHINLSATCSTNLPVSLHLTVVPVDKNGNEIRVEEDSQKFSVPANAQNVPVSLSIKAENGGTITDFDGVKFRAIVKQDSGDTEALGPDLYIVLDDLRVTVDGYYETDF